MTKPAVRWKLKESDVARTMSEVYGISEKGIRETVVLIDTHPRFFYKGSHMPKLIDRLLHGKNKYNVGRGSILRIGTRFRTKARTSYEVNYTLAHELEHVAQYDRKDVKIVIGHFFIWSLTFGGAFIGSRVDGYMPLTIFLTVFGALVGHQIGYSLAPHELQARKKARQVSPLLTRPVQRVE